MNRGTSQRILRQNPYLFTLPYWLCLLLANRLLQGQPV